MGRPEKIGRPRSDSTQEKERRRRVTPKGILLAVGCIVALLVLGYFIFGGPTEKSAVDAVEQKFAAKSQKDQQIPHFGEGVIPHEDAVVADDNRPIVPAAVDDDLPQEGGLLQFAVQKAKSWDDIRLSIEKGGRTVGRPLAQRDSSPTGATGEQLHGAIGVTADGDPAWEYKQMPKGDDKKNMMRGGGFNVEVSDATPFDRPVMDTRAYDCKTVKYPPPEDLPEASVIIVFYNEVLSILLRSVHSVLNRTPPNLLREIILVDDNSKSPELQSRGLLEDYLTNLPNKVRLVRNPTRTGIVGARLLGISSATADVFVILDSHIEVQEKWLEPLVSRIAEDKRRVVMPQIDSIDPRTLEFRGGGIGCTLGIIWKLMEHAFNPNSRNPTRMHRKVTDYLTSPAMAGGLFAANREFFWDIGAYDRGLSFWGVENLELSFRLWQCGGQLECSQCSRVYHIFRQGGHGYSVPPNTLAINKIRTMAVWMDDYADLAWKVQGRPHERFGNLTDQLTLRKELQCKSFEWFLNSVWPEGDVQNLERDVPFLGNVRNKKTGECMHISTTYPGGKISLKPCRASTSQEFMYFKQGERIMPVRNDETCLKGAGNTDWCHEVLPASQKWVVNDGRLMNKERGYCLGVVGTLVSLNPCDAQDESQEWEWDAYQVDRTQWPWYDQAKEFFDY